MKFLSRPIFGIMDATGLFRLLLYRARAGQGGSRSPTMGLNARRLTPYRLSRNVGAKKTVPAFMTLQPIAQFLSHIFYGWRMVGLVSAIRVVGGGLINIALLFSSFREPGPRLEPGRHLPRLLPLESPRGHGGFIG